MSRVPDVAPERLRGRYNQESGEHVHQHRDAEYVVESVVSAQVVSQTNHQSQHFAAREARSFCRSNGDVAVQTNSDLNVLAVPLTGCRVTAGARMQSLPNTSKTTTNRVPPVNGQRHASSSSRAASSTHARCLGRGFQQHCLYIAFVLRNGVKRGPTASFSRFGQRSPLQAQLDTGSAVAVRDNMVLGHLRLLQDCFPSRQEV